MTQIMKRSDDPPGGSSPDELLGILREETRMRRRSTRSIRTGFLALVFILAVSAFVPGRTHHGGRPPGPIPNWDSLFLALLLLPGGMAAGLTPRLRSATKRAAELRDARALGALVEALDCGEPRLVRELEGVLSDLLAAVREGQEGSLDDVQLRTLIRALEKTVNQKFFRAAMHALRVLGTAKTLYDLEVLENSPNLKLRDRSLMEGSLRRTMGEIRIRLAREQLSVRP